MKIRHYTWQEFDQAVATLQKPVGDSLFPIPRGGLVLATALSHKYDLPIVKFPTKLSIYVDDIADSGKTIRDIRLEYMNAPAVVLLKRYSCRERGIICAEELETDDWIVFPWENQDKAKEDYERYISGQRNL